jgi:hypothetical protein
MIKLITYRNLGRNEGKMPIPLDPTLTPQPQCCYLQKIIEYGCQTIDTHHSLHRSTQSFQLVLPITFELQRFSCLIKPLVYISNKYFKSRLII